MAVATRHNEPSPAVIVGGGGVTGTAITWRLTQSGQRVLLLDVNPYSAGERINPCAAPRWPARRD